MSHPSVHGKSIPEKTAFIMAATGESVTYGQLEARSNQGAHLFRSLGLKTGDCIAIFMENNFHYLQICWAAQRAGLYFTCISSRLTAGEIEYIVKDSGAQVLITSSALAKTAIETSPLIPGVKLYMLNGAEGPFEALEPALDAQPITPIADEAAGSDLLYSSGTTGRPKGVKVALTGLPLTEPNSLLNLTQFLFGFNPEMIYLSPAPLYHAAPLRYCMAVGRFGGTVVVMEHFDPEQALALIEKHIHCGIGIELQASAIGQIQAPAFANPGSVVRPDIAQGRLLLQPPANTADTGQDQQHAQYLTALLGVG